MAIFKIVILGDGAVGKTSLRDNFMGETFAGDYLTTIGVDFASKDIEIDGAIHKAQIWDLAGQERFNFLRKQFLKGAHGAIFVFDATRVDTAESAEDWLYEVEQEIDSPIPIYVLGNKIDVVTDRSSLPESIKIEVWKKEISLPVLYTSAKTGENVDKAFKELINGIFEEN